jgi:hypothetical protein
MEAVRASGSIFGNVESLRPRPFSACSDIETDDSGGGGGGSRHTWTDEEERKTPEIRSEAEEEGFQHIGGLGDLSLSEFSSPPPQPRDEPPVPLSDASSSSLSKKSKRKRPADAAAGRHGKSKARVLGPTSGVGAQSQVYQFPSSDVHLTNEQLLSGSNGDAQPDTSSEPFDPFEVVWDEHGDDEAPADGDDEFCSLCNDGQTEHEREANPRLAKLHEHYERNKLQVEETRNCRQVTDLHNRTIREHTSHRKYLPPKIVHQHYTIHAPTPKILQAHDFSTFNYALAAMRKSMLFRIDRKGGVTVEPSNFRLYMQIKDKRDAIMKVLFNSGSNTRAQL